MRTLSFSRAVSLLLVLYTTCWCGAKDLFVVTAHTTSGPPQTLTVSGNNLPDLVNNLIKNQQEFVPLENRNIAATLRYAGINNAVSITKNSANTSASVDIPSIGLHKTFSAANEDDLKNQ